MRVNFRTSIKKKNNNNRNLQKRILEGKNVLPYFPLKNVQNTAKTY